MRTMALLPVPPAPPLPLALAFAGALLVLPLAMIAHWVAIAERGGERAWFAFAVRAQLFLVASLFLDVPAVLGLGLERAFGTPAGSSGLPLRVPAWEPAVLIALVHLGAAAWAGRRVRRRLRGASGPATSIRATLFALLARLAPILGLLGALVAMRAHEPRLACACALAGFALSIGLAHRSARVLGLSPEAVTAGPLRERVFDLAARAGVRVEQLLVLAARDARLVNAFAMQGRRVVLTDTLLARLSRREVDGVVAHELAHLRSRHPQLLTACLAVACPIGFLLARPLGAWGFALAGIVAWLVVLLLARSFEWSADRQAVAWTGDAEAMISAIAKISRANDVPLDWGPWTGLVLTHPPTRARALALARAAGWPRERAEHVLRAPVEVEDADRWPYDLDRAQPIAGTGARMRGAVAVGWGSLAASTLGATLVVLLQRLSPVRGPAVLWFVASVAAAWAALLVAFDRLAVGRYAAWRAGLAARLRPDAHARYVGLSPGMELRNYEGLADWDIGFLAIDPRGLEYRGERTRFTLPRGRIVDVESVPGIPSWIPAPRIVVHWRSEDGAERAFTLRGCDARAVHRIAAANAALADELRAARAAGGDPDVLALPLGAPPDATEVTGQDPRRLAGWRTLPAMVLPIGLLSCAAALIAGLPFWPWAGPGALEVFGAGLVASVVFRAPLLLPRRRAADRPRSLQRAA